MIRVTPAEGQLRSPAGREPLPRVQPGLRQHLGCGQLPPCGPALPPRSAAPAQPSRPPSSPPSMGSPRPPGFPSPWPATASSQTCSVAAAAAAAAAILARRSPRLRSGTGVGLTPSTGTPCHALTTPPKEIQSGQEPVKAQIPGGWSLATMSHPRVAWVWQGSLGHPQFHPKHAFTSTPCLGILYRPEL